MTIEPCFYCGVDSVGMCRICEERVCNRHMIMSVTRVNISGFSVALVHPQGETLTSMEYGAYLEGFEGGPSRCLACRERDGRQALAASRDLSGIDLGTVRAGMAAHATAEESRKAALHRELNNAMRIMDEVTAQAISDFLAAAREIELQDIDNGTRKHQITKKGRFGISSTETVVEEIRIEAHVLYTLKVQYRNYKQEELYVLPDGRVLLRLTGYEKAVDFDKYWDHNIKQGDYGSICEELILGPVYRAYTWSRRDPRPGLVPFHLRYEGPVPDYRADLTPGPPGKVEHARKTADWFVKALASYLESHANR